MGDDVGSGSGVGGEARLATVRFGPGSALLAPNLNLNLMFGSVRPWAEPEHKNSVPNWLKPIKTSDFVKKNSIFHKYFSNCTCL